MMLQFVMLISPAASLGRGAEHGAAEHGEAAETRAHLSHTCLYRDTCGWAKVYIRKVLPGHV